jgi:hypothetical protein
MAALVLAVMAAMAVAVVVSETQVAATAAVPQVVAMHALLQDHPITVIPATLAVLAAQQ